jgi:hypothetical protein
MNQLRTRYSVTVFGERLTLLGEIQVLEIYSVGVSSHRYENLSGTVQT